LTEECYEYDKKKILKKRLLKKETLSQYKTKEDFAINTDELKIRSTVFKSVQCVMMSLRRRYYIEN